MVSGVTTANAAALEPQRPASPSRLQVAASPEEVKPNDAKAADPTADVPPQGRREQATAEDKQAAGIDKEELSDAVRSLADYVQNMRRELQFTIDEATGRTVVTVTDADTGETIRQIPAEEVLALAHHLDELEDGSQGLILRTRV
jgi:flagellar protein FlaG